MTGDGERDEVRDDLREREDEGGDEEGLGAFLTGQVVKCRGRL